MIHILYFFRFRLYIQSLYKLTMNSIYTMRSSQLNLIPIVLKFNSLPFFPNSEKEKKSKQMESTSSPIRSLLERSDFALEKRVRKRKNEETLLEGLGNGDAMRFFFMLASIVYDAVRFGENGVRRLTLMIVLTGLFSTMELTVGIVTGQIGLVSDAFHLTFGCGLLIFSLLAMLLSETKPDGIYTYGYKRLEVLAAFTNTLFLLFMSFSLAVEALHTCIQDESEHKHYLNVSAVINLLLNLVGVWFFRSYARVVLAYRKAEDMNYHSLFLHVLADSIRSVGIILVSWLLTLGVENAEAFCLGLVSIILFVIVMPLFRASGSILLQKCPSSIPSSAFSKCQKQITALEDDYEVSLARFWEFVPGHTIGSLSLQLKDGADDNAVLNYVQGLYQDLGIKELTVQTSYGFT